MVTSQDKAIARILPPHDVREKAKQQLEVLRKKSRVGDVISPIDETWDADR
jgi:hypothetical protein